MLDRRPSPARLRLVLPILAGFLAILATLLLLHAGGVVEGQDSRCYGQQADSDTPLEVCLANAQFDESSRSVRSEVEVNRVIEAGDRPGVDTNRNLHDNMSCSTVPSGPENPACIVGGIRVYDSYFGSLTQQSRRSDRLIAFAIRQGEQFAPYEQLNYRVCDDGSDEDRIIQISINQVFVPGYGYTIKDSNVRDHTRTVSVGNSDVGGEPCEGATVTQDPSTEITLSVNPDQVGEAAGQTNLMVTGTLNGDTRNSATVVSLSISNGTASSSDYSSGTAQLTIPANQQSGNTTLSFTPENDSDDENSETVSVGGTTTSGLTVNPATVTIIDNDGTNPSTQVTLSVNPTSVGEGAGQTNLQVTGTLNGDTRTSATVVSLSISNGTASTADYNSGTAQLTIPENQQSGTAILSFTPVDDSDDENSETVSVGGTATSGLTVNSATVTIIDNDGTNPSTRIALSVSPTSVGEGAGQTNLRVTGTLNGDTRTSATVVSLSIIPGSGSNPASTSDFRSGTASLTISQGQTSGTATLSITPVNNSADESNKTVDIRGTTTSGLTVNPATVTIVDDDPTPCTTNCPCVNCRITNTSTQVTLSVIPSTVNEDAGQTDLVVKGTLNADPRGSATVVKLSITLVTASDSDFSSGTVNLTIPAGSTEATATLSFTPVYDSEVESSETVEVGGTTSGLTVNPATVTIENVIPPDTTPSVIVSKSEMIIDEEGAPDTYTVKLDTEPSSDVTIAISVVEEDGDDVEEVMPDPATLTFTPGNGWDNEQTVTVSAGHDDDTMDDQATVTHTATSDDEGYNGLDIDGVAVTVYDNDGKGVSVSPTALWIFEEGAPGTYTVRLDQRPAADVIIAISVEELDGDAVEEVTTVPNSLTFTPVNYSDVQMVEVSAGDDDDTEDDEATITHTATSDDGDYDGIGIDSVAVTVYDNDAPAGVAISPTELWVGEGGSVPVTYSVNLRSEPKSDVTIAINIDEQDPDDVEEVTANLASLTFTPDDWGGQQTVAISAGHDEDTVDDQAVITHTATSDDRTYSVLDVDSVAVTVYDDDAPASVDISPAELWIDEGKSDAYTIRLRAQPMAAVNIAISAIDDVTISPSSVTFTPSNWSAEQWVDVNADHDEDTVDDEVTITHLATSTDSHYDGLDIDSIAVTVFDDDAPLGVEISPTELWIDEGASGAYTVRLRTEPTAAVNIAINADEELTVSPSSLTYTLTNWRTERNIIVTADHDADSDDEEVEITHMATSIDSNYNGLDIDSVAVTVYDDDAPAGVAISPTELWIDEGESDAYRIKLSTEPTADVNVSISTEGEVTVSPSSLTFTPVNWRTDRDVTVTAGHDADSDDDEVQIAHTSTSIDSNYNGLGIDSVAVTVYDDDAPAGVAISPTELWIDEGESDAYRIKLSTEPTADVNVSISTEGEVTVSPSSLTFTPVNWRTDRDVTVTAGHDADSDDDEVEIAHTSTSIDSNYNGLGIDSVAVTVYDDDAPVQAAESRSVAVPPTPTTTQEVVRPTEVPTPAPMPTAMPMQIVTQPNLQEPGAPAVGESEPRGRNLLERAAAASRDRLPLVIILAIVLIVAGLAFVYLILRRR